MNGCPPNISSLGGLRLPEPPFRERIPLMLGCHEDELSKSLRRSRSCRTSELTRRRTTTLRTSCRCKARWFRSRPTICWVAFVHKSRSERREVIIDTTTPASLALAQLLLLVLSRSGQTQCRRRGFALVPSSLGHTYRSSQR